MERDGAAADGEQGEVEREQEGIQANEELAVHQGDELLPKTGKNQEKQAAPQGRTGIFGPDQAQDGVDQHRREPAQDEGENLPAPGIRAEQGQRGLVDHAPEGPVGGEVLGERVRAKAEVNPGHGELVPVEAELRDEQAIGQDGDAEEQGEGLFEGHGWRGVNSNQ